MVRYVYLDPHVYLSIAILFFLCVQRISLTRGHENSTKSITKIKGLFTSVLCIVLGLHAKDRLQDIESVL